MSLPISRWMEMSESKFEKIIKELEIYEVKKPDMNNISLRDIIYLLKSSREEIHRLVVEIQLRDINGELSK